jgi:hypothetical protein
MQASTGQYSTHAGDPAQPVQLSMITANILGFFFLRSGRPCDIGSIFTKPSSASTVCSVSAITSPINQYNRFAAVYYKPELKIKREGKG